MDAYQERLIDVPEVKKVKHPAKYSDVLLPVFIKMLRGSKRVLDPFAGTAKLFQIEKFLPGCEVSCVEIEPEWAALNPRTTLGNALDLPWFDNYFDAICTSPAYGSRMADCHNAQDGSRRNTYTHAIGHKLHPDNAGAMQWGPKYKEFHAHAWEEAKRVLCVDGIFVLNIKDHIRAGKVMKVTRWHKEVLQYIGFKLIKEEQIETPSNRQGANGDKRLPYESVILFRLEAK